MTHARRCLRVHCVCPNRFVGIHLYTSLQNSNQVGTCCQWSSIATAHLKITRLFSQSLTVFGGCFKNQTGSQNELCLNKNKNQVVSCTINQGFKIFACSPFLVLNIQQGKISCNFSTFFRTAPICVRHLPKNADFYNARCQACSPRK